MRTSSVRTVKIESGNGENLKGRLLSGGATCLRRMGENIIIFFRYGTGIVFPGLRLMKKMRIWWQLPGGNGEKMFFQEGCRMENIV